MKSVPDTKIRNQEKIENHNVDVQAKYIEQGLNPEQNESLKFSEKEIIINNKKAPLSRNSADEYKKREDNAVNSRGKEKIAFTQDSYKIQNFSIGFKTSESIPDGRTKFDTKRQQTNPQNTSNTQYLNIYEQNEDLEFKPTPPSRIQKRDFNNEELGEEVLEEVEEEEGEYGIVNYEDPVDVKIILNYKILIDV